MKKEFVKPVLTRYDLNSKENIVASASPAFTDGELTAIWSFIYSKNEAGDPVDPTVPNKGCFNYFYEDMEDDMLKDGYLATATEWYGYLHIVAKEDNPKYDNYCKCARIF